MESASVDVGRAALAMAISEGRQEEQELRKRLSSRNILATAVDFGGEYLPSV
ncbi:MAG TPA: HutP family protein, partial [Negativicutes bacterium]